MTYMQFRLPRPACTEALWCSIPHVFKRGAGSAPLLRITFCFVLLSIKVTIRHPASFPQLHYASDSHWARVRGNSQICSSCGGVVQHVSHTPQGSRFAESACRPLHLQTVKRCLSGFGRATEVSEVVDPVAKMIYSAVQPYPQEVWWVGHFRYKSVRDGFALSSRGVSTLFLSRRSGP